MFEEWVEFGDFWGHICSICGASNFGLFRSGGIKEKEDCTD